MHGTFSGTGVVTDDVSSILAPDGALNADQITLSDTSERITLDLIGTEVGDTGATVSVWARSADATDQNVKAIIYNGYNNPEAKLVLGEEWVRVALETKPFSGDIEFELRVDDDEEPGATSADFVVWGAQIEPGMGVTPYLPTGHNFLVDTEDWSDSSAWAPSHLGNMYRAQGGFNANVRSPDGTDGVYSLTDSDPDRRQHRNQVVDTGGTGDYTFSVWMKADSPTNSRIRLQDDVGGWNEWLSVGTDWQRFQVSYSVVNPGNVSARIFPADVSGTTGIEQQGTVYVWGAQLEKGTVVSSYQKDGLTEKDWGLDVGVVGAQLVPVDTFDCNPDGSPYYSQSECSAWYGDMRDDCCMEVDNWDSTTYPDDFYAFYAHCTSCADQVDCGPEAWPCHPDYYCEDLPGSSSGTCVHSSTGYTRNTYERRHVSPVCSVENPGGYDYPWVEDLEAGASTEARKHIFKNGFQYIDGSDGIPGYYSYTFNLNVEAIEQGAMGQFGVLAAGNFNYRIRTVAMNIVGTDVLDCSLAESPSTCAANQWVSYDFKQMGEVYIRNHHDDYNVQPFNIPTGLVSGGKAWAAEQVIGYPMSGAHQNAISQLQKVSLMGRPMQGTFELRIYDVPELVWENVEDIQLVLGYHYWTKSE